MGTHSRGGILAVLATATALVATPLAPAKSAAPTDWLGRVNFYRSLAGLSRVTENATYSDGDRKHAIYMVQNNYIGHDEDPAKPYYTAEGHTAAQNSNAYLGYGSSCYPDGNAIDGWTTGPFHALGVLRRSLVQTGFGTATRQVGNLCYKGAALDVLRGRTNNPTGPAYPYSWPGNGTTVPLFEVAENETPDPLSSCDGYSHPAGLPVYAFFAGPTNVTAHSFIRNNQPLDHCVYDAKTYDNPNAGHQTLGRAILNGERAVVLIPRAPLVEGATYTASVTSNGVTKQWTFTSSATGGGNGGGGNGTIGGTVLKVTNRGNVPLAGAKVCVQNGCAFTATNGSYSFTGPAGTVTVRAKARKRICSNGETRSQVTTSVGANETKTIDWTCVKKR